MIKIEVGKEYMYDPLRRKVRVRHITGSKPGTPDGAEKWAVLQLTAPRDKDDLRPINVPESLWAQDISEVPPAVGIGNGPVVRPDDEEVG